MQEQQKSKNWGGARPNSGRKKGVKTSPNTEVFYAKCTLEEKEQLTNFLKSLRALCFLVLFFCLSTVPAMANSLNVELPSNLPQGVSVGITIAKTSITMSFKNTAQTSYALDMNNAYFIDENSTKYRALTKEGLNNYIQGNPVAKCFLYNTFVERIELFPIENNRTSIGYDYYAKRGIYSPVYSAYSSQVPILGDKSVLKNKNFVLIIPCKNNSDYSTQNLVFKFSQARL